MSIVKMKHLRLVALQSDREPLMTALRDLGSVEPRAPTGLSEDWDFLTEPDQEGLAQAKSQADSISEALDVLKRHTGFKAKGGLLDPLPQVEKSQFFDEKSYQNALETAAEISEAQQELTVLTARKTKLVQRQGQLKVWLELPVNLDFTGTAETSATFAFVPKRVERGDVVAALDRATDLYDVTWCGEDKDNKYLFLLCHSSVQEEVRAALVELGGGRANLGDLTGEPRTEERKLEGELAEVEAHLAAAQTRLENYADRATALNRALDRANQDVALERAKLELRDTQATFLMEGWFPAAEEGPVRRVLDDHGAAFSITDPTPEEYPEVPIQLKNGPIAGAMNPITEMYSMPAYDGIDPNPLMAPFFILFFGLMMNDIGYGLLMVLGTGIFLKRARPKGTKKAMMTMFFLCGISSIFWGCLTGSFFGDFLSKLFALTGVNDNFVWFWPPLFTPINDIILVMIGSICLGVIQVFTGMAISAVHKCRQGKALDALFEEVAWWVILGGAALAILGLGSVLGVPVVLILGLLMLLIGNARKAKGFGIITGFFGAIYNGISGYFSDILSYLRLMALMMAGSIIASVFNTLGSVFGLVPFIIVAIIGNALNLILNLLGCYVHTLRLQCLEFFGRFYVDGGKPFRPLRVDTKSVDIIKEEM